MGYLPIRVPNTWQVSSKQKNSVHKNLTVFGMIITPTILLITSMYQVNEGLGFASLALTLSIGVPLGFLLLLLSLTHIKENVDIITAFLGWVASKADILRVFQPYAIALAFLQVALWVMFPTNPNFEPRAEFSMFLAGFIAYFNHNNKQKEENNK